MSEKKKTKSTISDTESEGEHPWQYYEDDEMEPDQIFKDLIEKEEISLLHLTDVLFGDFENWEESPDVIKRVNRFLNLLNEEKISGRVLIENPGFELFKKVISQVSKFDFKNHKNNWYFPQKLNRIFGKRRNWDIAKQMWFSKHEGTQKGKLGYEYTKAMKEICEKNGKIAYFVNKKVNWYGVNHKFNAGPCNTCYLKIADKETPDNTLHVCIRPPQSPVDRFVLVRNVTNEAEFLERQNNRRGRFKIY